MSKNSLARSLRAAPLIVRPSRPLRQRSWRTAVSACSVLIRRMSLYGSFRASHLPGIASRLVSPSKLSAWAGTKQARQIVYGLFIAQVIYLIFAMRIGVPPDELTHIRFIEYYKEHSLSPFIEGQESSFFLGDITREVSYLYHYVSSLIMRLLPLGSLAGYVVLRFVSLALAFGTLVMSAKLGRLLKIPEHIITIGLFVITNASEFLLMSAAINNDQVVWLAAASGLYLLVKAWQEGMSLRILLLLASIVLLTSVAKKTFLPVGAVLALIAAVLAWRARANMLTELRKIRWPEIVLLIVMLVSLGLFVERIGNNIVRYGSIDVRCDAIHSTEQCLQYGVFRRNYRLDREGPPPVLAFRQFAPSWWHRTLERVFGPQAWTGTTPPAIWFTKIIHGLVILSLVGAATVARKKQPIDRQRIFVFLLGLAYIIFNMLFNYQLYQRWGTFSLALQGRYIFPVIVPLVLVAAYFISLLAKKLNPIISRSLVLILLVLVLTQSGLRQILRTDEFVRYPLAPQILFDTDNAIAPYEPGI